MTLNSHLQMTIVVLCKQRNGASWSRAIEWFRSIQPSMHRWQDNIAASDRPHIA